MSVLYCDMDGVLCDFVKSATLLMSNNLRDGSTIPELNIEIEKVKNKGIYKVKEVDFSNGKYLEFKELLYLTIKHTPNYWLNLEWMKNGKKLWDSIERYNPTILTSHIDVDNTSCYQKKKWCEIHLGLPSSKVICEHNKELYAIDEDGTRNIIIDDRDKVIKPFRKAGGIAIKHDANNLRKTLSELHKNKSLLNI